MLLDTRSIVAGAVATESAVAGGGADYVFALKCETKTRDKTRQANSRTLEPAAQGKIQPNASTTTSSFFKGYDLDGNSYWEFYLERQQTRPRRIVEPLNPERLIFNYFDKVPIQWAQWLRYARHEAPTPIELIKDQERVKKLQALASIKDQEQAWNKALIDDKIEKNMYKEMDRLHAEQAVDALNRSGPPEQQQQNQQQQQQQQQQQHQEDPWKKAQMEEEKNQREAVFTPRR
ncbi:hypothetical protein CANINC_001867 [Pichia inconspicua]|uniref:NADH dehydrogenase [ubiquinone] 1 alpha subcomplex subunit n=1 Tax=Pichia inconspicua TaxID=52247 RepID=A0A4T0X355_9ASCO|nr:hypothetical protein CANINC_001867 [[Candida] inconspicua]